MNPNVEQTQLVLQPVLQDYSDSLGLMLTWAMPFAFGLAIAAFAAFFFRKVMTRSSTLRA